MPLHLSWPRFIAKSWIGNHLMDCPWPNSTQSISKPTFWRLAKTPTTMTRMSVSHALNNTDFVFCLAAWTACVKILKSASSWLQGCRPSKLMDLFDNTFSPLVTTTTLSGLDTILSARYSNSSVLLSLSLRKLDQMGGWQLSFVCHSMQTSFASLWSRFSLEAYLL